MLGFKKTLKYYLKRKLILRSLNNLTRDHNTYKVSIPKDAKDLLVGSQP